jgi:hypothetical protein
MKPGDWHGGDDVSLSIAERFGRAAPWYLRFAFVSALWVLEFSPPLLSLRFKRFSSLDREERLKHLKRFSTEMPFAIVFAPLRPFMSIAAYSRPDVMAAIGYSNRGLKR